jgi:hypothetical protein
MHAGTILGDFIYFTNFSKTISRINTTDSSPSATILTDEIKYMSTDFAGNVFSYGCLTDGVDILYTYGETTNTSTFVVFKTDLSTLSVDAFQNKSTIALFPNPSNDFINMTNLKNSYDYEIYCITGQQVKSGKINPSESISIKELSKGLYFLKLNDGSSFKLIKN